MMSGYGPFDPLEWDEFLRDVAEFELKIDDGSSHYVIDMPRDDIECRVIPGFSADNKERVSHIGKVVIRRKDGEVIYTDAFEIHEDIWRDQFREKMINVMKNWRSLVI